MNITFEEAKQQVAEKYCSELGNTWDKLIARDGLLSQVKYINEAAELWQKSNLDRIKELEDCLRLAKNQLIEAGFEVNSNTVAHIKNVISKK